jgi:hypothetical protein
LSNSPYRLTKDLEIPPDIKLTIEPDGSVSFCALQSTDMDAPLLTEQVETRVGTFDFGAKEDIAAVTIIYPIDFLPAA